MSSHKEVMIEAAKAAGEIIMSTFKKSVQTTSVGVNLVSETDEQAEKKIIEILTKDYPYTTVAEHSGENVKESEHAWVIDPIDGTSNFCRSQPGFGVSIALIQKGKPVEGVIFDPLTDELLYAQEGQGVTYNGGPLPKPLDISRQYIFVDPVKSQNIDVFFNKIFTLTEGRNIAVRKIGCIVVSMLALATGRADAVIASGQELWDLSAANLVCAEAGVTVTDWNGEMWEENGTLLAAREPLYGEFLTLLKS